MTFSDSFNFHVCLLFVELAVVQTAMLQTDPNICLQCYSDLYQSKLNYFELSQFVSPFLNYSYLSFSSDIPVQNYDSCLLVILHFLFLRIVSWALSGLFYALLHLLSQYPTRLPICLAAIFFSSSSIPPVTTWDCHGGL